MKSHQCRIAFLVPFFGELPLYFAWWAKTCEGNQRNVHWYVYNDHIDSVIYYNGSVTLIPMKFDDVIRSFKEKLNIDIIKNTRRLCDYRILFSFIRNEEESLDEYDFIGYTDIDVVYGDIMRFLPDDLIEYSIVSGNRDRPCGPFTIINKKYIKNIILSDIVRKNIESHDHLAFDESHVLKDIVSQGSKCYCNPVPIQPALVEKFNYRKTFSVWHDGRLNVYDNMWHKREGGFYHFSRYKNKNRFKVEPMQESIDAFCVYKYGIAPMKSRWMKFILHLSLLY